MNHIQLLRSLNKCPWPQNVRHIEAIELYAKKHNSIEDMVNKCSDGSMILRLADALEVDHRAIFRAKGHCAELAKQWMDDDSVNRVNHAIMYGEGLIDNIEPLQEFFFIGGIPADRHTAAFMASKYAIAPIEYISHFTAIYTLNVIRDNGDVNKLKIAEVCKNYAGDLIIEKFYKQLNNILS